MTQPNVKFAATLILWLVSQWAFASSTLSFEGGDYWIDLEIGTDTIPMIAAIRFYNPADSSGVQLPSNEWHIETFDTQCKILVLTHKSGNSGIADFSLLVKEQEAKLTIEGKTITSSFNWDM